MTHPRLRRLLVGLGLVAGVVALAAAPAAAHALRVSSSPDAGATLPKAPTEVTVTFGEQPDPALSSLLVLDSSGQNFAAGKTSPVPGQPLTLEVAVKSLTKGVYTVSWRTVSKVDGHIASGTYAFGVQESPKSSAATGGVTRVAGPADSTVAARWAMYVGLMLLFGAGITAVACYREPPARLRLLLWTGVVLGLAGAVALAVIDAHQAGVAGSKLLSSSIGHAMLRRAVPVAAAAAVLLLAAALRHRDRLRRVAPGLVAAAGAVAMWGDVDGSHAAAAHSWRHVRMAIQWAHFAAAGVWVGGLALLVLSLRALPGPDRARAARRFSTFALGAVIVIAASGGERAFDEIHSWHKLFSTSFGQLVIVKSALFAALVCLGAVNRFRSVRAAADRPGLLARVGRGELVLVAGVLVATGVLQGLAPPATVAAAAVVKPIVLHASDFGTTVKETLTVSPGTAGFNHFTLQIADYDTAKPVDGNPVQLTFRLPSRPDLGNSTLTLKRTTAGRYEADAPNLSINGTWQVTALVQRSAGGVEVPFTVSTRQPPVKIIIQRSPGVPTLYTLQLPANQSVQTYLDPGKAGAQLNEFHVTFIGAGGNEIPMASATVTAEPPGPPAPVSLTVRRLDPIGHFVSDLRNAVKGSYKFVVTGTTTTGSTIQGTFTIPVA